MSETLPNATLDAALAEAREAYVSRNPSSLAAHVEATASLPGGNTRSVLFHGPFPLLMARGEGCRLWDADGHRYVDLLGEYTAGLYGHSHPVIRAALDGRWTAGGTWAATGRWRPGWRAWSASASPPSNWCASPTRGTEANLMALATAVAATGRRRVMVFDGGYHGGVLYFRRRRQPGERAARLGAGAPTTT